MKRYRTTLPLDDPPMEEGDLGFIGVNDYDIPENLQPGQLQSAINLDVTDATASTRGGLVCLPSLAKAPFGQYWTSRSSAANLTWSGHIAYGNAMFVAVAQDGVGNGVMTSRDGITWISRTPSADNIWMDVTFGNGIFVAVANTAPIGSSVMTSYDGITWTSRTATYAGLWNGVAYGNGTFVAVGSLALTTGVMTSTNGITWVERASSIELSWQAVTYGNGLFVAVSMTGTGNRVMTSPNGITWTTRTSAADDEWRDVAYGNGMFVAVSSGGTVMSSPDGITWTLRTAAAANYWARITYGGGTFVAVSNNGTNRVMTSPDGITWTSRSAAVALAWYAVGYGNNMFVAASYSGTGNRVMTSITQTVWASGVYSDPNATSSEWMVLAGSTSATFYAFGQNTRTIDYPTGYVISSQSTIVQANNLLFIFAGTSLTPIQWDGNWSGAFAEVTDSVLGAGFQSIPHSNQATYYQNRLWAINGKDAISTSDVLSFSEYDTISNDFNLNTGTSDYVVTSYPWGENGLVVFKHKSSILLQNVQGSLSDVTTTDITRQFGIIGINAVTSVGPDLVYMSDRNISTVRLNLQNQLQHATQPLSRNIQKIIKRVNWSYAYKVSMAYWDNSLYVALPVDNSTTCNIIVVYNFITEQWWGEWNFASSLSLAIQGFLVANYQGAIRLHCVSEDGRIFVVGEGQNDISGVTVAEITTTLTSRAYRMDNNSHIPRRMWIDVSTNRPTLSVDAYADGAGESESILSSQTFARSDSWLWNDSTYDTTNANDDFNRAFRKDYSSGALADGTTQGAPATGLQCGTGFQPEMRQSYRFPIITRRKGRLSWFKITNTTGFLNVNGIGVEARAGDRGNQVQVG